MPSLREVGVLVTRPEQQAIRLCRLLEAEGATSILFPAIDIAPCAGADSPTAHPHRPEDFDLIVFVSANAVRFGVPLLRRRRDLPLAAIGPATARALVEAGYPVAVQPSAGFDSESLLAHPGFATLSGRRVLLVKGGNGREVLAQELRRRGATVETVEVYLRRPRAPTPAEFDALERDFSRGAVHVITATSLEIAETLLGLATPVLRAAFDRVHWLVPSARVADGIRRRGLQAPLLQAVSAEDQDLVDALVRWRSAAAGA